MARKTDDAVLDDALSAMEDEGSLASEAPVADMGVGADEGAATDGAAADATSAEPTGQVPAPTDSGAKPDTKPDAGSVAEPTSEGEAQPTGDDPLAGTKPFEYQFDGQGRIFDAILMDEETGGLLVPPDKVQAVQNVFAYAEKASRDVDQLTERLQQVEGLLVAKQGDTELRGPDAVHYWRGEVERMNAGGSVLWNALKDPDLITALGYAMQNGDQAGVDKLLASVAKDMKAAVVEAEYRTVLARTQPPAPSAEAQQTQRVQAVANAVSVIAKQYPSLLPDDVQKAQAVFGKMAPALARAATAQDVAQWPNNGFKVGDLIVDRPQIEEWIKERADFRRAQTQAEQDAKARGTAAGNAGKFNAGQQRGRQPAKSAGNAPAAPAQPAQSAPKSRAAAWNEPLAAFLDEAGIAHP